MPDRSARPRLVRAPDWDRRLADFVGRELARAFVWGSADCATFAIDAVAAVTGSDLGAGVRRWDGAIGALRALRDAGATSALGFFADRLPEIAPAFARRGDLVVPRGDHDSLMCPAVLVGADAMSRSPGGIVVFPRRAVARAFRVGD